MHVTIPTASALVAGSRCCLGTCRPCRHCWWYSSCRDSFLARVFGRFALPDPLVDFRHLELPQPPNLVGRHLPVSNPTVNCVLADPQMLGDLLQGHPWFRLRHLISPSFLKKLTCADSCRLVRKRQACRQQSEKTRFPVPDEKANHDEALLRQTQRCEQGQLGRLGEGDVPESARSPVAHLNTALRVTGLSANR